MICIDFETAAIMPRPDYPPKPAGLAVRWQDGRSHYYAFGHPLENNSTKDEVAGVLRSIWDSPEEVVCHNAAFDLDVACTHFGLPMLPWERLHDTMFLAFLVDPHSPTFALKPLAERYLGVPPTERDAVRDWLVEHGVVRAGATRQWGAHIADAPGDLVGRYAVGDVDRTAALYDRLAVQVTARGMGEAYDRERKLLPILLRNGAEGMRVDVEALVHDEADYAASLERADNWLRLRLLAPGLNVDSDQELAEALFTMGIVTTWDVTATGQRSTSKKSMVPTRFSDPEVASVLGYRNRLQTCLATFMRPWIVMATRTGRIYTSWNQVRSTGGFDTTGARTGRLSSTPNLQNIPKTFADRGDGYAHPDALPLRPLPLMRRYILPDKGGVWLHRDYSQQELRILAHFENDGLEAAYQRDPHLDVHTYVQSEIARLFSLDLPRGSVKVLNFGMLYGLGVGKLAEALGTTVEDARRIKGAQRAAIPGIAVLEKQLRKRAADGEPVTTWGGRQYYCEPEKDGRTFEYKMLNYLIQGSAADCTKEAMIRYDAAAKHGRLLCCVHDELNVSAPVKAADAEMKLLAEAMESVEFSVPMLSEPKTGPCWGELRKPNA